MQHYYPDQRLNCSARKLETPPADKEKTHGGKSPWTAFLEEEHGALQECGSSGKDA
jgi:hypothetical protein